jgi:hypothetical protein
MSENKTHFRKVYKSDHLGVADLEEYLEEGRKLDFTISQVKQEINVPVAGRKGDYNIAYFVEKNVKPLVLNATNAAVVKSFCGGTPWVEDWRNVRVTLYADPSVKMKGTVVGGVRIFPKQPTMEPAKPKQKPLFTEENFEAAKKANATIELIKQSREVSVEIEKKYLEYVGTKK